MLSALTYLLRVSHQRRHARPRGHQIAAIGGYSRAEG